MKKVGRISNLRWVGLGALCVIALLLAITPKTAEAKEVFYDDVDGSLWYMVDGWVPYVTDKELMTGYDYTNSFGPEHTITRGQIATILYRYDQDKTAQTTDNNVETKFTDVPKNRYYSAAVKWASELGVITGYPASNFTQFEPEKSISRQELATMIHRYCETRKDELPMQFQNAGSGSFEFDEVDVFAKESMVFCFNYFLINGINKSADTYETVMAPKATATRAQVAKIMTLMDARLFKHENRFYIPSYQYLVFTDSPIRYPVYYVGNQCNQCGLIYLGQEEISWHLRWSNSCGSYTTLRTISHWVEPGWAGRLVTVPARYYGDSWQNPA